jgi:hypothetical protein
MSPGTPVIYTLVFAECNRYQVLVGKLKKDSMVWNHSNYFYRGRCQVKTHICNYFKLYVNCIKCIHCIGCFMNMYVHLAYITQDSRRKQTVYIWLIAFYAWRGHYAVGLWTELMGDFWHGKTQKLDSWQSGYKLMSLPHTIGMLRKDGRRSQATFENAI